MAEAVVEARPAPLRIAAGRGSEVSKPQRISQEASEAGDRRAGKHPKGDRGSRGRPKPSGKAERGEAVKVTFSYAAVKREAALKAKPKTAPAGPSKRPGELRIESKAEPKPTPVTGEKRPAETPAEELDPRATGCVAEKPGSVGGEVSRAWPQGVPTTPPVGYEPPKPSSELTSLVNREASRL